VTTAVYQCGLPVRSSSAVYQCNLPVALTSSVYQHLLLAGSCKARSAPGGNVRTPSKRGAPRPFPWLPPLRQDNRAQACKCRARGIPMHPPFPKACGRRADSVWKACGRRVEGVSVHPPCGTRDHRAPPRTHARSTRGWQPIRTTNSPIERTATTAPIVLHLAGAHSTNTAGGHNW
jgi:hypothetical protein